jgi:NAD(P)-dependent dehydrogenase (short-subunit alcohol dehydrogenase family)
VSGLDSMVVVVAGGATGIGERAAVRLAEQGARVVVGDVDGPGAEATAAGIVASGGDATAVTFDIADEDSVEALFRITVDTYGGVDHLFNVAADLSDGTIGRDSNVVDIDLAVWDRTITVNLRGFLLTMRGAIPLMLERGGGAIVNTSSDAAYVGEPERPSYAAAKAAVLALTRHVASRWGREGIRCNAVAPGLVVSRQDKLAGNELWEQLRRSNPMGRLGTPDDIATTVVFLMSDEASWVNGQTHRIDGGTVML